MARFIPVSQFARDPNAPREVPRKGGQDFNPLVSAAQILQFGTALGQTAGQIFDSADKGMLRHLSGASQPISDQEAQAHVASVIGGGDPTGQTALAQAPASPLADPNDMGAMEARRAAIAQEASQRADVLPSTPLPQREPTADYYSGIRTPSTPSGLPDRQQLMQVISAMPQNEQRAFAQMLKAYETDQASDMPYQIALEATGNPDTASRLDAVAQQIVAANQMESLEPAPTATQQPVSEGIATPAPSMWSGGDIGTQGQVGGTMPALTMPQFGESAFGDNQYTLEGDDDYDATPAMDRNQTYHSVAELFNNVYGTPEGDEDISAQSLYASDADWKQGLMDVRNLGQLATFAQNANTLERQNQVTQIAGLLARKNATWSDPDYRERAALQMASLFPKAGAEQQFRMEMDSKGADIRRKGTQSLSDLASAEYNRERAATDRTKRPLTVAEMEQEQRIADAQEERDSLMAPVERNLKKNQAFKAYRSGLRDDRYPAEGSGTGGGAVSPIKSDTEFIKANIDDLTKERNDFTSMANRYAGMLTQEGIKLTDAANHSYVVMFNDMESVTGQTAGEIRKGIEKQIRGLRDVATANAALIQDAREVNAQVGRGTPWNQITVNGEPVADQYSNAIDYMRRNREQLQEATVAARAAIDQLQLTMDAAAKIKTQD